MKNSDDIKARLSAIGKDSAAAWENLNDLYAEFRVLSEVVQCMAAQTPNLNAVMESLLSRKDQLLAEASPGLAQMYAQKLDRWHTHLLYAQRVEGPGAL